eukprot:m.15489 g.15489  ORF g.15489 m.15489 type:complete len:134 (+) comp6635_c0_seq1:865-1266(+)
MSHSPPTSPRTSLCIWPGNFLSLAPPSLPAAGSSFLLWTALLPSEDGLRPSCLANLSDHSLAHAGCVAHTMQATKAMQNVNAWRACFIVPNTVELFLLQFKITAGSHQVSSSPMATRLGLNLAQQDSPSCRGD